MINPLISKICRKMFGKVVKWTRNFQIFQPCDVVKISFFLSMPDRIYEFKSHLNNSPDY